MTIAEGLLLVLIVALCLSLASRLWRRKSREPERYGDGGEA